MGKKTELERWYSLDVFGAADGKKELLYKRFGRFSSLLYSEEKAAEKAAELFGKHKDIAFVDIYEFITDEHSTYSERIVKTVIRSDFEKKEFEGVEKHRSEVGDIRKDEKMAELKWEVLSSKHIATPDIFSFIARAFEIGKGEF